MDRLTHDIRIALRGFRRTPSFTITAVLILAVGIGMAVAMFTVYDAVLVRNLPVREQDRVVELYTYQDDPKTDYYLLRGDLRTVASKSQTMRDVAGVAHWGAPGAPFLLGDRPLVINRAAVWMTGWNGGPVPYSQSTAAGDLFKGYRRDCSGFASWALAYAKPGTNTVGLASSTYTTHMSSMQNLKMGDLVIDATGTSTTRHVVIFEKWANSAHSSYWAYEQSGDGGTHHRTRTYGLGSDQYDPYRPKKLA